MYAPGEYERSNPKPFDPVQMAKIAKEQAAAQQAASDPFLGLQQILASSPQYSGPSCEQMAASEFGPQFQALQQVIDAAQNNYITGNQQIGDMFTSLSNAQKGQTDDIRQQYDQTGQRIGGAYNDAIQSVTNTYGQNQSALLEMMSRLGIGQAAGTVLGTSQDSLGNALGSLARSQASRSAFNSQQGQNEIDYNNRNADTTALAGKNKQSDLLRMFQGQQTDLNLKKLDLTAAQTRAANQYNQSIQDSLAKQQQNAIDTWFKQQQLGLQFDARDDRRAGLELDAQKWAAQLEQDNQSAAQRLKQQQLSNLSDSGDVFGMLAANAGQYYGDSNQAASAIDRVTSAYSQVSGQRANLSQFLGAVTQGVTDPIEARKLQALATIWWNQLNSKGTSGYAS